MFETGAASSAWIGSTPRRRMLIALGALLSGWVSGEGRAEPARRTVMHGPFEIVVSARRVSAGGFPNTSGNPFKTREVATYSVRWKGQEVAVAGGTSRFWRVLRLTDAPRPALIAITTELTLVHEVNGALLVQSLSPSGTSLPTLQWLDAQEGQPGPTESFGIDTVPESDNTEWSGGRWLRASGNVVLDVRDLSLHAVRPWVPSGSGQPLAGLSGGSSPRAAAFSTTGKQYVLPANGSDPATGQPFEGLVVVDIPTGDAYGLTIDHQRMRYIDQNDIGPDWIRHYFDWKVDAKGSERLVARSVVRHLPWKGRIVSFGRHVEYRVEPVTPEMQIAFKRFLVERFGARAAPSDLMHIPACEVPMVAALHDTHITLFAEDATNPPRCQDWIRRIGTAFDAELATGRLDRHFIASASGR